LHFKIELISIKEAMKILKQNSRWKVKLHKFTILSNTYLLANENLRAVVACRL
jgi:hypothetical protein